ncbi:uncharacterized protein [Venturia canescens]|uniref:uncharacterized protein n=1 Tax=Venturia canescens TaxID=32260 RepID=UPI001C9CCAB1|nr:uncharacterized protein LOC122408459 [Venturia canescens]
MSTSFAKARSPTIASTVQTTIEEEVLLNDEDVKTVMERKLGKEDFCIENWSLDRIASTNGYLGQYYHLCVTCTINDRASEKFVFFAKTKPPSNSPQYEFAVTGNVFTKENVFYEDIAKNMGAGEGPKWMVDCYLGKGDVIVVLEDATLDGFEMPDKFVPFEYDECAAMFYALAKLHSRSVVLDEKLRRESGKRLDQVYGEVLQEALFPSDDRMRRNPINSSVQGACGIVNLIECLDDRSRQRVKSLIADWSWRIPRLIRTSKKYRNVICHQDPWANNMLIKRHSKTARPHGFYLIDFQFIRYSPPAIDFMLALYLTTRRKTRDENFEKFTRIYHDHMREELWREKINIDDCNLSWTVFRQSCEYYRFLAIIYTIVNQQIMLLDGDTADKYFTRTPELLERVIWGPGRQELVCPIFATDHRYRERLTEIIIEIYERLDDFEDCHVEDY